MAQDKMLAQAKPPRPSFADSLRRKPDPNEDALVLTLPSVVDDMAIPRPGKPGVPSPKVPVPRVKVTSRRRRA